MCGLIGCRNWVLHGKLKQLQHSSSLKMGDQLTNLLEETRQSSRGRLLLLLILILGHVIDTYSWKLAYFPSGFLLQCSSVSNHSQVLEYQFLKNMIFALEIPEHCFFRQKSETVYSVECLEKEKNKEKLLIPDGYCFASWLN